MHERKLTYQNSLVCDVCFERKLDIHVQNGASFGIFCDSCKENKQEVIERKLSLDDKFSF